jgi:hypothetical protein
MPIHPFVPSFRSGHVTMRSRESSANSPFAERKHTADRRHFCRIFPCRTEFVTKLGPQISLLPVPIFGVNKLHENDLKFHPDAPLIKANKLTVEDLVKQNFDLEDPGRLDRPLQAVRPPLPEKQPVGQTPTSSRPISRITPRIAAKLWK